MSRNKVELRDLNSGGTVATFKHPGALECLAWRSDGKVFATGCYDSDIYLWDVTRPAEPLRKLKGHFGTVAYLGFSRHGDLLLSDSWDSTTRLWDAMTGQQLVTKPGCAYYQHQFSSDDQWLDHSWQVAAGGECRTFHGPTILRTVSIAPGGRLVASASARGVRLWDLAADREGDKELADLPVGPAARAEFDPDGKSLITDGSLGLQRWPIMPDPDTAGLRIGPPQSIGWSSPPPGYDPDFTLSRDGRTIAHGPRSGQVFLYDPNNPNVKRLIEAPDLRHAAFSPDGRWLATGNWRGRGARVWDARTGKLVHNFELGEPDQSAAWPAFSPDGKWLVTGTFAEYCFWEVGSWQKKLALPRENAGKSIGWIVFSPDGSIVALLYDTREVRLVDPATGRPFAHLPSGGGPCCFSPDGSQLVTNAGRDGAFQVWDLRLIRRQLAEMGLDWDLSPYPPPPNRSAEPLRINWDDAIAALRQAIRLQPKNVVVYSKLAIILQAAGRHAEGLRALLAVIREHPDLTKVPRNYLRYNAACLALNCADGLGVDVPPEAERPACRKQAFDFLTAELAVARKVAARDRVQVHRDMQTWLSDKDLVSVRDPMALGLLPPGECDPWNRLWAEVRALRDRTGSHMRKATKPTK